MKGKQIGLFLLFFLLFSHTFVVFAVYDPENQQVYEDEEIHIMNSEENTTASDIKSEIDVSIIKDSKGKEADNVFSGTMDENSNWLLYGITAGMVLLSGLVLSLSLEKKSKK